MSDVDSRGSYPVNNQQNLKATSVSIAQFGEERSQSIYSQEMGATMEVNKKNQVVRAKALATFREAFERLDLDKDGLVDKTKLKQVAMQAELGASVDQTVKEKMIEAFFGTNDVDRNIEVPMQEWLDFCGALYDEIVSFTDGEMIFETRESATSFTVMTNDDVSGSLELLNADEKGAKLDLRDSIVQKLEQSLQ